MWTGTRMPLSERAADRPLVRGGPVADADLNFAQIWQNTSRHLDADGIPAQQRAFLSLARLAGLLDGTALVKVPNDFTKDVVETRVRDAGHQGAVVPAGHGRPPRVTVDSSLDLDHTEPHRRGCGARSRRSATSPAAPPTPPADPGHGGTSETPGQRRPPPGGARSITEAEADPAEPEVHLRHLRHRREQPLRPRGRRRGRRGAGQGVQPALRLRRVRPGQDPPAARHRPLRPQPLPRTSRCAT